LALALKLSDLNYKLPNELIANSPVQPRDHSRLMVLDRNTGKIRHKHFYELVDIVRPTDVLVFNNTKVMPVRVIGKKETGGKVEALFLKNLGNNLWEILGKGIPPTSHKIIFANFYAIVVDKAESTAKVKLYLNGKNFEDLLQMEGQTPIPPYIDTGAKENDLRTKYQTVYAKIAGSAAAPTAGFHFTKNLLAKLTKMGVQMEFVTLHVGLGTFLPIKENNFKKHKMHSEWFSLDAKTAARLNAAKSEGRRIIAVGTTSTRVLEACSVNHKLKAKTGETDIFIYPPYKFKFVDSIITNFHLPHSTLLALVSAFVSSPNNKNIFRDFKSSLAGKTYEEAIENKYRFYSFGDAMIIL
jgi:S-adenosylmethionine:tRNA ribosyltransferase-isomerase